MVQFLAWIYDQASKVYDWFSDRYWSLVYNLSVIWDWVTQQISIATRDLSNWVASIYNNLHGWVQGWFDWFIGWINNVINWINSRFTELSNWVSSLVNTVYSWTSSFIATQIKSVTDWVTGLSDYIIARLTEYIDSLISSVRYDIKNILTLYSQISKLICLTDDNILSRLLHLVTDGFSILQAFISNPLGFVFGIIEAQFIHFLADQIGIALGSVDAQLPNKQDYNHPG